ncbi:MAG: diacylglycerol kinase [Desulfovibrio sp.]|nr:diacylglycerol kinase [Desulfovibrio sp.]
MQRQTLTKASEQGRPKGLEGIIAHLRAAFGYSCEGLTSVFADELAFRLIVLESLALSVLAFSCAESFGVFVLLLLPSALALLVELINSALEACVDRISLDWHPLAKKAKDAGSAAQFIAQAFLLLVWLSFWCFAQ